MSNQRQPHYLDESLSAALNLSREQLPSEVARVLINLCGSVRALERENDRLRSALVMAAGGSSRVLLPGEQARPQLVAEAGL